MKLLRIFFTAFIYWGCAYAHCESAYAKPVRDFQVGYPIEAHTLKLYPLTELTLQRKTDDAVFVTIADDPTVYKLDRYGENGRNLFETKGDSLAPLEMLHKDVDQEWMLFSGNIAYQIVEQQNQQLTVRYPRGEGAINVQLPAAYFKTFTSEEIAQVIADAKAEIQQKRKMDAVREQLFNQSHVSQQQLTLAQRDHQQAEQRLQAYLANPPTPYRTTTKPTEAACIVENVQGSGSGFLGTQDGRIYLFTNIHMLTSGGGGLKVKMINGPQLMLGAIELARDRDLARIAILTPNLPALEFDYSPQIGESITAYGNSSGGNVITELKGKALGIGPTEIEISAEVVPGNSGGPILNQSGQVLAVVTRGLIGSSSRMAQGTRFSETRRFAARLTPNLQWDVASYRNLLACQKTLNEGERELAEFRALDTLFSSSWDQGIREENLSSVELTRWSKSHNNLLAAIGEIDNDDLRSEMAALSKRLSGIPYQRARHYQNYQLLPENAYYRDQLNEIAGKYAAYNNLGKHYADAFARNPPQAQSRSNLTTSSAYSSPIGRFQNKDLTQYQLDGDQAYCLVVCKGIRATNLVQLVFSFRPGTTRITMDAYVDGSAYGGTVTIVANGRKIDASRSLTLKDYSAIAKALRREVHLGPQAEWAEGYQMMGDRPLHQFIDFVEDQTQR